MAIAVAVDVKASIAALVLREIRTPGHGIVSMSIP